MRAPPAHSGNVTPAQMASNLPGSVHPLFGPPPPSQTGAGLMSPRPPTMAGAGAHPLAGLDGAGGGGGGAMTSHPLTSSAGGGGQQVSGQSIVVPTPTRTRTIKSYHCRMCDQVSNSACRLLRHQCMYCCHHTVVHTLRKHTIQQYTHHANT